MVVVGDATCRALRRCFGDDDRRTNIEQHLDAKSDPKTTPEYSLIYTQGFLNVLVYHPWLGDMSQYCR